MTNRLGTLSLLTLCPAMFAACSNQPGPSSAALTAGTQARAYGIEGYALEARQVALLDSHGVEVGRFVLSKPTLSERVIDFDFADGTQDKIELSGVSEQPHGSLAVIVDTPATAVLVDPALASLFAHEGMAFSTADRGMPTATLDPNAIASTTVCTTPAGSPWTNNESSNGCARPANPTVGCYNSAASPPAIIYNNAVQHVYGSAWQTSSISACTSYCSPTGGVQSFSANSYCMCTNSNYTTINSYVASCPASSCTTPGMRDGVPRQKSCQSAGVCMNQQGVVACVSF